MTTKRREGYGLKRMLWLLVLGIFLGACSSGNETTGKEPDVHSEETSVENKGNIKDPVVEEEEKEEAEPKQPINDLEEIFRQMEIAIQSVDSVTITGQAAEKLSISGTEIENSKEMVVNATFNPFVQHALFTDSTGGKTEWYATEDTMYVNINDSGWEHSSHPLMREAAQFIHHKGSFERLIVYEEFFELTQDDHQYIITYNGPDEVYQEIFFGGEMEQYFMEMVREVSGITEDIKMSGTVEMKVSKDTFLIEDQHSIQHASMENQGMIMETVQEGTYSYVYNEVGGLEIPVEVRNP